MSCDVMMICAFYCLNLVPYINHFESVFNCRMIFMHSLSDLYRICHIFLASSRQTWIEQ